MQAKNHNKIPLLCPEEWLTVKDVFMCIRICLHVRMHSTCAWYLRRPEKGSRSSGAKVTGGCELPCEC